VKGATEGTDRQPSSSPDYEQPFHNPVREGLPTIHQVSFAFLVPKPLEARVAAPTGLVLLNEDLSSQGRPSVIIGPARMMLQAKIG
jgi:hypothetical protein